MGANHVTGQETVRLDGGPLDGLRIPLPVEHGVLMQTRGNMAARYRRTRDPDVYRFQGWDRVVARIELATITGSDEGTRHYEPVPWQRIAVRLSAAVSLARVARTPEEKSSAARELHLAHDEAHAAIEELGP
jgi:hypothetical protein